LIFQRGGIEFGESLKEILQRDLEEEVGLRFIEDVFSIIYYFWQNTSIIKSLINTIT
jgi:8-oxo-dGTP pyrophosphatase MutT (NUDIX family)